MTCYMTKKDFENLLTFISSPTLWGHSENHCYCKKYWWPISWISFLAALLSLSVKCPQNVGARIYNQYILSLVISMNVDTIVLCSNSECRNVLTMLVQRQKARKTFKAFLCHVMSCLYATWHDMTCQNVLTMLVQRQKAIKTF